MLGQRHYTVFSSPGRYCITPGVGVGGVGFSKMLKFYAKVFYVMGKALSGKLFCPCDRSCLTLYFVTTLDEAGVHMKI